MVLYPPPSGHGKYNYVICSLYTSDSYNYSSNQHLKLLFIMLQFLVKLVRYICAITIIIHKDFKFIYRKYVSLRLRLDKANKSKSRSLLLNYYTVAIVCFNVNSVPSQCIHNNIHCSFFLKNVSGEQIQTQAAFPPLHTSQTYAFLPQLLGTD